MMLSSASSRIARLRAFSCGSLALVAVSCSEPSYPAFPMRSSLSLPEVPRATERALSECVTRNLNGTRAGDTLVVMFDVEAQRNGEVRQTKIRDSMIPGTSMESCMKQAVDAMRVPGDVIARSANGPASGHVPEDARKNVGIMQVLVPIIVEMVPVVIKVVEVTVVVVVSAVVADEVVEVAKRKPRIERRCAELRDQCLENPYQPPSHQNDFGRQKDCGACFRECLRHEEWPDYKCPRTATQPH